MKRNAQRVIFQREEEKKKSDWYKHRHVYLVKTSQNEVEKVVADGYFIYEDFVGFYIQMGDERLQVATFKNWISFKQDLDALYESKIKTP